MALLLRAVRPLATASLRRPRCRGATTSASPAAALNLVGPLGAAAAAFGLAGLGAWLAATGAEEGAAAAEAAETQPVGESNGDLKLFSGTAHLGLAQDIAATLGVELGKATVGRFNDGEVKVLLDESVRGKDVYVIQSTSPPVNDNLMELLLMISALRHASAKRVTAVIPYFGYKRANGGRPFNSLTQDARSKSDDSMPETHRTANLAASDVARMLNTMGADRVVTIDLQPSGQGQSEGFFACPIEAIDTTDCRVTMLNVVKRLELQALADEGNGLVVVSSHSACLPKAQLWQRELKKMLGADKVGLAGIVRTRLRLTPVDQARQQRAADGAERVARRKLSRRPTDPNTVVIGDSFVDLFGKVRGKDVLIVEDMMDTAATTCRAAEVLKMKGARRIYAFASHAVLSEGAVEKLKASAVEKVCVLDTVPLSEEKRAGCGKFFVVSVADEISATIQEMHEH